MNGLSNPVCIAKQRLLGLQRLELTFGEVKLEKLLDLIIEEVSSLFKFFTRGCQGDELLLECADGLGFGGDAACFLAYFGKFIE